jgi:hypothetical protein
MGERPDAKDRPNTLGQAWRKMSVPRRRADRDLPTLPDWPPLRDEPVRAAWPSLEPAIPDEIHPADALQPTEQDPTLWPERPAPATPPTPPPAPPPHRALLARFRNAPKRAKIGLIAGAGLALVVLIVACSNLALRTSNGLVSVSAPNAPGVTQGAPAAPSALPTVTPHPTDLPTPTTAPPPALTLAFTCASGSLHGTGQVCVHTLPRTALAISVRYCDGSTAKGLRGVATADASGNYTWNWPVRTSCAGQATATVTASLNGQSITQSDSFTITK